MNATIILTSTVNVNSNKYCVFQKTKNERLQTYLASVFQWLYKTNFDIILVENSGYIYEELNEEKQKFANRFEVITYNEPELKECEYLINNDSKGASEIFSINYAFSNSKLLKPNSFIIKIAGRFFIPELEDYLLDYDLDSYDCLTQYNRNRCEMVGCNYKNFSHVFNPTLLNENNEYEGHIENIWKYRTSFYDNVLVCRRFAISKTQRGGLDEVLYDV
jgi:hypothetical protein